jgi:hypothetical protein
LVILFGRNVASYKFFLAKSLLEIASTGKTEITLEELAKPFSKHLIIKKTSYKLIYAMLRTLIIQKVSL